MDIDKILANAPTGATHCTDTVPSMNLYAKVEHLGGFYVRLGNRWESYPIYAGIHLLDDLREISKLRAERDQLADHLASVLRTYGENSGLEPSLSVF